MRVVHDAAPDLATPRRFLGQARSDLRAALPAAWEMFRSDLKARARVNLFGHLWLILPAVSIVVICLYLRQQGILRIDGIAISYPAFLLTGLIAWQIFAEAVSAPHQSLAEVSPLIGRNAFPHEIILIAAALRLALNAGMRTLIILPVLFLAATPPGVSIVLLPAALFGLLVAGFAIGLFAAPLVLVFRDLGQGLTVLITFGMFVSGVVYPVPPGSLMAWNPMVPLVAAYRAALTGGDIPLIAFVLSVIAAMLALFGWFFTRLARPYVVENLG